MGNYWKYLCLFGLLICFLAVFFLLPESQPDSKPKKIAINSKPEKMSSEKFDFNEEPVKDGKKFFSLQDGDPIPYWTAMTYLKENEEFRKAFIKVKFGF